MMNKKHITLFALIIGGAVLMYLLLVFLEGTFNVNQMPKEDKGIAAMFYAIFITYGIIFLTNEK